MIGHAVANATPVAAANRILGTETGQRFYGSSFVADARGDLLADMGRDEEGVAIATIDLAAVRRYRASFGFFRDRRPDLYGTLTRTDGEGGAVSEQDRGATALVTGAASGMGKCCGAARRARRRHHSMVGREHARFVGSRRRR